MERAFRGAMNPRKRSGIQQQGPQNSSASWRRIQQERIRATQQVVTGGTTAENAQAQARRRASRGQGLNILQREAKISTAQLEMPCSRAEWSWDCSTPSMALGGKFVSASAYAFLPHPCAKRLNFRLTHHCATEELSVAAPHMSVPQCGRGQASEPDRHRLGAF